MKRKSKIVSILLIAFVLLMTGCKNKEGKNASNQNSKGRYVESQITLPEGLNKNAELKLTKKDGMPYLYALTIEEQDATITGYQMNQDSTWTENTPEWIKSLSLPAKSTYEPNVIEGANGNQYLYYREFHDNDENQHDSFTGHLLCSTDGTTYKTLNLKDWDVKDPGLDYHMPPEMVNVLADSTIVTLSYNGEVKFYDGENLSLQKTITDTAYVNTILTVLDQSLILGQKDNDEEKITGIDVYDTVTYDKVSYPFQASFTGYPHLDINEKKEHILCDSGGIHVLERDASLWQTVVDGTLTSLTMQTMWRNGFVADSEDNYYVLYFSDNGYSLMKYSYDETIGSLPATELTIYSLSDNSTLRQAAAIFQQEHPDVKVNITVAMTNEEYEAADATIKEDYIRALNTELLAGGGHDILVLDGLPTDSFMEKGVLADITDTIQPMIDSEQLYPGIMNNYIKDDKIYYVPARFGLQILCSKNDDVKNLNTLEALADYSAKHMDNSLLGNMTLDDFINTFAPYLSSKIMDNGTINKEKLVFVLKEMKIIGDNSGIVDEYADKDKNGYSIFDLTGQIQLNFNPCAGFLNAMYPLGVVTYVNGNFTSFENSFIPSCELGINNTSEHKELAKDFISLVLSEKIQKVDLYDGFSINKPALILCSQADQSNYSGISSTSEDGSYIEITWNGITKEQATDLVNACSMASTKAVSDE